MSAAAAATAIQQPPWLAPERSADPSVGLKLNNSLTRQKEPFHPISGSRHVTWYSCGPTVYDASHMGHARSYLTFDILRRVMEDYFGYQVTYVMNITDIDDKIIVRARQNYLLQQFKEQVHSSGLTASLLERVRSSWDSFVRSKLLGASNTLSSALPAAQLSFQTWSDLDTLLMRHSNQIAQEVGEKYSLYCTIARQAHQAIVEASTMLSREGVPDDGKSNVAEALKLVDAAQDCLVLTLDAEMRASVSDHQIFRDLTLYWESEFMKDMRALNVRPATILTRVTEYVPEIVTFIEKIIQNGYAYESAGSVYFDVEAFKSKHHYAKLAPWAAGHSGLLNEGEGSLGACLSGKKSVHDFALWKASKPGEPFWSSPWGHGRPGWHIECSVMASDILGECMDIHSGGIDLCFPHHDNELAQSEAYFGNQQWVNYFLHAGHLHIEGQKMSKSLKNFITIKEALQRYTAAQIRFMILMHAWDNVLDYQDSSMATAVSAETSLRNFFETVKALGREDSPHIELDPKHGFRAAEHHLFKSLHSKRQRIHEALCDNFNTVQVISIMLDLVGECNVYLKEKQSSKFERPHVGLLEEVAKYLTKMLRIFGVIQSPADVAVGFPVGSSNSHGQTEDIILPFVKALATFRDQVRNTIRDQDLQKVLDICDAVRDDVLPKLGVLLEDRDPPNPALIKLLPAEEIERIRMEKLRLDGEKARKREDSLKREADKRRERLEKGRVPPQEMFRIPPVKPSAAGDMDGFSRWDEQGIPTHDLQGEELPKSRVKKLKKLWDAQEKAHNHFLEAQDKGEIS